MLKEDDVKSSHLILCFEESSFKAVNAMSDHCKGLFIKDVILLCTQPSFVI